MPSYFVKPYSALDAQTPPSTPSIDIFVADDVVLAQIAAGLHLDQHHRHLAGVLHPVFRAQGI